MNIQHKLTGSDGLFFIKEENSVIAELIYSMEGEELMLVKHVEVEPELRGKGIGNSLVREAANYAREKGIKIRPLCYFAKVSMRSDEYKDVLA